MADRSGEEFTMWLELRQFSGRNYVFLTDSHQLGSSRLAQDAMFYIEKVSKKLNLDVENTVFYRHICTDHMGSLFGRFVVNWAGEDGPKYRFQMLTNIDDLQNIKNVLSVAEPIDFTGKKTAA